MKNLIILKFRNKYACALDIEDELNKFIQAKMDELFAREVFDERDLVGIDKEIGAKYQEIVKSNKGLEKVSDSGSKGQQATLKKLDKLEDLQSHEQDEWEGERKANIMKTFSDANTRYKVNTIKDQRTLPDPS